MSEASEPEITLRLMTAEDVDRVPIDCQGGREALLQRCEDLGAAAVLAFDGEQHVAQLQFRRYDPALRSPDGLWDPLYWGDFGAHAPDMPADSLAVFCYHVGQLEPGEARDPRYQGRGIGLALLDAFLDWAECSTFAAVVAKCTPPYRPVMAFMGGQPPEAYLERGFSLHASWTDGQLREVVRERGLVPDRVTADAAAEVGCCVKRLREPAAA